MKTDNKSKKSEVEKIKSRQIRLVIITFTVVVLVALVLWLSLSALGVFGEKKKAESAKTYSADSLEQYISENWNEYEFVSFDAQTGLLIIKGSVEYPYEKAEKYGAAVFDEDYMNSYVNLVQQVAIGVSVDCDVDGCTVELQQYSTDGKIVYTVDSNGQITTCWGES
ncbi:MAG: hypothetical protein MJ085_06135 [Clostridia bacterium]|nr:hypothetical protein [Clostridia bacterium]